MAIQDVVKMRVNGATYKEIADAFDVSVYFVRKKLAPYSNEIKPHKRGRTLCLNQIIYKGIKDHFTNNKSETITSLCEKVGVQSATLGNCIRGKTDTYFTIPQIKRMCKIVGKPFEEVFERI